MTGATQRTPRKTSDLLAGSDDREMAVSSCARGRKSLEVRIAWRDAELFHTSKREQRFHCSLLLLCWRQAVSKRDALELALARFARRRAISDRKEHLLAWWATVLLDRTLGPAAEGLAGEMDSSKAARATNDEHGHTFTGEKAPADRGSPASTSSPVAEASARLQLGIHALQQGVLRFEQRRLGSMQEANSLKKLLADERARRQDAENKMLQLQQKRDRELDLTHEVTSAELKLSKDFELARGRDVTAGRNVELVGRELRADRSCLQELEWVERDLERSGEKPPHQEKEREIKTLKEELRFVRMELETARRTMLDVPRDTSEMENVGEGKGALSNGELRQHMQAAITTISSLVRLVGSQSRVAENQFLDGLLQASKDPGSNGKFAERNLVTMEMGQMDLVAAVNEMAALMLLRCRMLEAEKNAELDACQLQLDEARLEISDCYAQLEELALRSGQALAEEELKFKQYREHAEDQYRKMEEDKTREREGGEGDGKTMAEHVSDLRFSAQNTQSEMFEKVRTTANSPVAEACSGATETHREFVESLWKTRSGRQWDQPLGSVSHKTAAYVGSEESSGKLEASVSVGGESLLHADAQSSSSSSCDETCSRCHGRGRSGEVALHKGPYSRAVDGSHDDGSRDFDGGTVMQDPNDSLRLALRCLWEASPPKSARAGRSSRRISNASEHRTSPINKPAPRDKLPQVFPGVSAGEDATQALDDACRQLEALQARLLEL